MLTLGLVFIVGVFTVKADPPAAPNPLPGAREKASYAFGMNLGRSWKEGLVDMDPEVVGRGLKDALAGREPLMTQKEMTDALAQFGRDLRVLQQRHREQLAVTNRLVGEGFLATNRTGDGVVALPSGLQYKILAEGTGACPDLTNWVRLKYHGSRLNGADFAGSQAQPLTGIFNLHNIIQGWTEALQEMKPGAKWRLFVPANLAYGEAGSSEVGPDETLVYDLELVSVLPGRPEPTPEELKNERGPDGD